MPLAVLVFQTAVWGRGALDDSPCRRDAEGRGRKPQKMGTPECLGVRSGIPSHGLTQAADSTAFWAQKLFYVVILRVPKCPGPRSRTLGLQGPCLET